MPVRVSRQANRLRLSYRMANLQPRTWFPPPEPVHDGQTVEFTIGLGSETGQIRTFSTHIGRLEVASRVFRSADNTTRSQLVRSFGRQYSEPVIFQAFYDWLYHEASFGKRLDSVASDYYWVSIFDMAYTWRIPFLVLIAFDR